MVKIKGKVIKVGNSYALSIRKALIESDIIQPGDELEVSLEKKNGVGLMKMDLNECFEKQIKILSQNEIRQILYKEIYDALRKIGLEHNDIIKLIEKGYSQIIEDKDGNLKTIIDVGTSKEQFFEEMDPDTRKIDIDRITTGITTSQRNHIIIVREAINILTKEFKQIPEEKIVKYCESKGLEESKVEEILQKLNRTGEIFQPKREFYTKALDK